MIKLLISKDDNAVLNHNEIRFRFLHVLYQKHYGGKARHALDPLQIVKEAGLENVDNDLVTGDIVYLKDKGLINGQYGLGRAMPAYVMITTYGIDIVEQIMNQTLEELVHKTKGTMRDEIEEIKKEEQPNKRHIKLWEYVKEHPDLIMTIFEKATKFFSFTM